MAIIRSHGLVFVIALHPSRRSQETQRSEQLDPLAGHRRQHILATARAPNLLFRVLRDTSIITGQLGRIGFQFEELLSPDQVLWVDIPPPNDQYIEVAATARIPSSCRAEKNSQLSQVTTFSVNARQTPEPPLSRSRRELVVVRAWIQDGAPSN